MSINGATLERIFRFASNYNSDMRVSKISLRSITPLQASHIHRYSWESFLFQLFNFSCFLSVNDLLTFPFKRFHKSKCTVLGKTLSKDVINSSVLLPLRYGLLPSA